jgi:hypothetical protein
MGRPRSVSVGAVAALRRMLLTLNRQWHSQGGARIGVKSTTTSVPRLDIAALNDRLEEKRT